MGLRIGLSGAGYIAPVHIAGWRAAGAEVVAISDPDLARAHFTADHHGIGKVYDDFAAMLDAGGIDVLDVAAPRQVHVAQSLDGLGRGLPVICQKPLAPSLAEAEAFARQVGETDRFMVHENWRFRPPYRQMRRWIDDGLVGDIRHASVVMRSAAMLPAADGIRPAAGRQPFMLTEPRLVIAEVMIHNIDAARYLLGDLALVAARATHADPELAGETSAALYLEAEGGMPVFLSGDMTAHGTPSGASDWVEILGSKGRITLENMRLRLHGPDPQELDYDGRDLLAEGAAATIAHFVERLREGGPFETGLDDNLRTLRLVDAAYDLADTGTGGRA
ncbi:Gfo/Idh/MocA family oxidoreductase [Rhodobacteraceae bacterium CCMM004]|nr:Gfo/Idh/MocA family oxidoreductase [Rhodobacteraceae bacterium CCMM004]